MDTNPILLDELKGSVDFFLTFTNLETNSKGFGLTSDSTKKPAVASIAAVGCALTAWVIAVERGYLRRQRAAEMLVEQLRNAHHAESRRNSRRPSTMKDAGIWLTPM